MPVTDAAERLRAAVRTALERRAAGDAFEFAVGFGFMPDQQIGLRLGYWVTLTLPSSLLGNGPHAHTVQIPALRPTEGHAVQAVEAAVPVLRARARAELAPTAAEVTDPVARAIGGNGRPPASGHR